MRMYKIGELAKNMHVSLDFIRFYEKKGLITPVIDEKNHYHYYHISQSEIIFKIQQYRRLGFSANDTVKLMKSAGKADLIQMYDTRAAALARDIQMSTCSIQYLNFLKTALSTPNGTWYITRRPSFWFLPHTKDDDYLDDPFVTGVYQDWAEQLPLVYSIDKCILDSDGTLNMVYHGRAIEVSSTAPISLQHNEKIEFYPEQRCIEYYLDSEIKETGEIAPPNEANIIYEAYSVVQEKKFETNGDIFLRVAAIYDEDGIQHHKFIIHIPIK